MNCLTVSRLPLIFPSRSADSPSCFSLFPLRMFHFIYFPSFLTLEVEFAFSEIMTQQTDLLQDRHLDQIMLSVVHGVFLVRDQLLVSPAAASVFLWIRSTA